MNAQAMKRLELETALRRAVERGELRLVYQPIMSLDEMGIDRVEALVRWQHPERGLVSPADFIPIAEETGLIVPIGQWVLRRGVPAGAAVAAGVPDRAPDLVMSVNLSPRQFQHPTLVEDIARILRETGLDPAAPGAGDHRGRGDGGPGRGPRDAPEAARHRDQPGDRRLRDGLLVAGLPEAVPGRTC